MNWNDPAAGYREAAAVLAYFRPDTLNPLPDTSGDRDQAVSFLLPESTIIYDNDGQPQWMLQHAVRRVVLKRLRDTGKLKAALKANVKRPNSVLQQTLEAYLTGEPLPLEKQSLEQLTSTLQVVEWLSGIVPDLPAHQAVDQRLEWLRLLAPFKYLAGDHFRGRKTPLDDLRKYVGGLPAQGVIESFARALEDVFSLNRRPPLLIYGPGGIGKSTLVSKFILQHVEVENELRFPFTYIDFDRPELLAENPETILLEALRQLAIQYPAAKAACNRLRDEWIKRVSDANAPLDRHKLADFLAGFTQCFLFDVKQPDRPYLLVLDTFEEVQYRSADIVRELFDFLNEMQAAMPRLRTVISGRARVGPLSTSSGSIEPNNYELKQLDRDASVGFLNFKEISDPAVAEALFNQVGGNPLSLSLAAEVFALEGAGKQGIRDLRSRSFLRRLDDSLIQGQLYGRILDYIHDKDVRKIAHPGLVLRYISADLIEQVLVEPCKLRLKSPEHAQHLYSELSREASLVRFELFDGEPVLKHRADVRRVMLDPLRQDRPQSVYQIHQNAIRYYERLDGPHARAEEIYHRLFVDTDFSIIDTRWQEGLEPRLGSALEEIPRRARPQLASRLRVTGFEVDWDDVGQAEWERHAIDRAEKALQRNRPQTAIDLLQESQFDEYLPGSLLYLLETQALAALERREEARRAGNKGVYSFLQNEKHEPLLTLYLLMVEIEEKLGNLVGALDWLLDGLNELDQYEHQSKRFLAPGMHLHLAYLASQTDNPFLAIQALEHARTQYLVEYVDQKPIFTHLTGRTQSGQLVVIPGAPVLAERQTTPTLDGISRQLLVLYGQTNTKARQARNGLCRIYDGDFRGLGIRIGPQAVLTAASVTAGATANLTVAGAAWEAADVKQILTDDSAHLALLILDGESAPGDTPWPRPAAATRPDGTLHLLNMRADQDYRPYLNAVVVTGPADAEPFVETTYVDDFVNRPEMHGAPLFDQNWDLVAVHQIWPPSESAAAKAGQNARADGSGGPLNWATLLTTIINKPDWQQWLG